MVGVYMMMESNLSWDDENDSECEWSTVQCRQQGNRRRVVRWKRTNGNEGRYNAGQMRT